MIHYERFGSPTEAGGLILAIHGWGGGLATFDPLKPLISSEVEVVSVDMPGYGKSQKPAEWTVRAAAAEPLVELIDALDGELTLLGNCSGAIFGMCAALERPQRFKRLVLIDPFAYFPWYFRIMVWPVVGRIFYRTAFENPLGRFITNLSLKHKRTNDSNLTASFAELSHEVVYQYLVLLHEVGGYKVFKPLRQISHIDVLVGERSFGAIHRSAQMWKSIWPHANIHVLPGAGHLPIEEATVDLAKSVLCVRNDAG